MNRKKETEAFYEQEITKMKKRHNREIAAVRNENAEVRKKNMEMEKKCTEMKRQINFLSGVVCQSEKK